MNSITIKPYTNVRKMSLGAFWDMVEAQDNRNDAYTYTTHITRTNFDAIYTTGHDASNKCSCSLSDFCAWYLDSQIRFDGVAIVLQRCEDFDAVLVIVD